MVQLEIFNICSVMGTVWRKWQQYYAIFLCKVQSCNRYVTTVIIQQQQTCFPGTFNVYSRIGLIQSSIQRITLTLEMDLKCTPGKTKVWWNWITKCAFLGRRGTNLLKSFSSDYFEWFLYRGRHSFLHIPYAMWLKTISLNHWFKVVKFFFRHYASSLDPAWWLQVF